jgi:amidase
MVTTEATAAQIVVGWIRPVVARSCHTSATMQHVESKNEEGQPRRNDHRLLGGVLMATYSRRDCLRAAGGIAVSACNLALAPASVYAQRASSAATPAFMTALDLAHMLREKRVSSVELTRYFIDRIERYDTTLNAVVVRDFDRALTAAARADEALARGEQLGPLHGVPMTIKESYDIAGLPTTLGVPEFKDNIAATDSAVVERFKAAGAHFMGKTNVPLRLADWQSYNEIYGTTNNPWNIEKTPGGSSGGAAAALAAGLTGLETGSDFGGSIRYPAHYCGVYGHKPTYGIVPSRGHGLPGPIADVDLLVFGPMARSAEDLAVALGIVAGADRLRSPGWRLELPEPRARSLSDLRIALWPTDEVAPVDTKISDRVQEIGELLARAGATVSDSARPDISSRESNNTFLNLIASATLAAVPDEAYAQSQSLATQFAADDRSLAAVAARASVLHHRSWAQHHEARTEYRLRWKRFFEDWDIVICPVTVTTAFDHDHRPREERTLTVNGAQVSYLDQNLFWAGLPTVAYLPSTVFPTGTADDGLPIGLQAIGAEFADRTTIEAARLIAREIGGFRPPPGYSA